MNRKDKFLKYILENVLYAKADEVGLEKARITEHFNIKYSLYSNKGKSSTST